MRRTIGLACVLGFFGLGVVGVLTTDRRVVSGLAFLGCGICLVAGFVAMRDAREDLADRFPPATWIVRRVMALRWTVIAFTVVAGVGVLVAAEAAKRALASPDPIDVHLAETYRSAGSVAVRTGGRARVFFADRTPLVISDELDEDAPADDQRYTPVGVVLRYERKIVVLLPYGDGGTRILLEDDVAGYRHLYAYVGDFWGPSYDEETDAVPSARAVPAPADLRTAAKELALAEQRQDVCYGWDIEIRSGREQGRLVGSSRGGVGRPLREGGCERSLLLSGWIDPLAGRFRRKGDPGDWELGWTWFLPGDIPQAALDAVDTPANELIEGDTQQPSDDGSRAGKGLLEHIWALPLLAQESRRIASVPIRLVDVPAEARPAPAARSDETRFADESGVGLPASLVQLVAISALLLVLFTLPVAVVSRVVRRVRGRRASR